MPLVGELQMLLLVKCHAMCLQAGHVCAECEDAAGHGAGDAAPGGGAWQAGAAGVQAAAGGGPPHTGELLPLQPCNTLARWMHLDGMHAKLTMQLLGNA